MIRRFSREQFGQDMIENALLLAFVVVGAAGVAYGVSDSTKSVWTEVAKATKDASGIEYGQGSSKSNNGNNGNNGNGNSGNGNSGNNGNGKGK